MTKYMEYAERQHLTPRQEEFLRAFAENGYDVEKAKKAIGLRQSSLSEWKRGLFFNTRYKKLINEPLERVVNKSHMVLNNAIMVLHGIMMDEQASNRDRITAATSVSRLMLQIKEVCDGQVIYDHLDEVRSIMALDITSETFPEDKMVKHFAELK